MRCWVLVSETCMISRSTMTFINSEHLKHGAKSEKTHLPAKTVTIMYQVSDSNNSVNMKFCDIHKKIEELELVTKPERMSLLSLLLFWFSFGNFQWLFNDEFYFPLFLPPITGWQGGPGHWCRGRLVSRHWTELPRGSGHLPALRQEKNYTVRWRQDVR